MESLLDGTRLKVSNYSAFYLVTTSTDPVIRFSFHHNWKCTLLFFLCKTKICVVINCSRVPVIQQFAFAQTSVIKPSIITQSTCHIIVAR